MKRGKFFIGLLIGALLGLLFWYYQKSTSAEDGALDVLDRLAKAETRARKLEKEVEATMTVALDDLEVAVKRMTLAEIENPVTADDLTQINGIGPVFAKRLAQAGITTFAALAVQTPETLSQVADLPLAKTDEWIAQAQTLSA